MEAVSGRGRLIAVLVLVGPSLVGMTAFYILPVLSSLVVSFAKWDLLSPIRWIGLANYANALADPAVQQALGNTVTFIAGYLPTVVALGLGLALLLNRRLKGRTFFRAVYFVPVVTSWVAVQVVTSPGASVPGRAIGVHSARSRIAFGSLTVTPVSGKAPVFVTTRS